MEKQFCGSITDSFSFQKAAHRGIDAMPVFRILISNRNLFYQPDQKLPVLRLIILRQQYRCIAYVLTPLCQYPRIPAHRLMTGNIQRLHCRPAKSFIS